MAHFLNHLNPSAKEKPRKPYPSYLTMRSDIANLQAAASLASSSPSTGKNPRQNPTGAMNAPQRDCDETGDSCPIIIGESRSIEIFFGKFTTFQTFHQQLCDHGVSVPGDTGEDQDVCTTTVMPEQIRKLVMVGHPMISFSGMSRFSKLSEAWVTNCNVGEGKWSDFEGMQSLHKLYIYNSSLEKLEPLHFQHLRILWVAGNRLQSLSFLGHGLPSLIELNAAKNEITCLFDEQLFKCSNLQILNLSGNPLCTVQDVQSVKILPALEHLYFSDQLYGKCPVVALCDGRTMLLSILTKLSSLDGKSVTSSELASIQDYVNSRSLYYYANSVLGIAKQVGERKASISSTNRNLESIGSRLLELTSLAAQYRRVMDTVDSTQAFSLYKNVLKEHMAKIEMRITKLKELANLVTKRLDLVMQISKWEQETEKWMKWIEYQSYGNTQSHIIQSVHGARVDDSLQLCGCLHHLLSALACPNLWPSNTITKLESVLVIKDKGMEAGMERTYNEYFAKKDEPVFILPPPEPDPITTQNSLTTTLSGPPYPYYRLPAPITKPIQTYTKPDYKPPPPLHSYPDSIPGLGERMQPLFMFLVPPSHSGNPLNFLHRILTEKTRFFKDIRVTNCLWIAANQSRVPNTSFAVVIVMKVLHEALQAIQSDKRTNAQHSWDCTSFCLTKPLSITPAYILNVSFTSENKNAQWHKAMPNDDDVTVSALQSLTTVAGKINTHKFPPGTKRRPKRSPFIRKVSDGINADLCSVKLHVTKEGLIEPTDPLAMEPPQVPCSFEIQNISKFLGLETTQYISTLDLSGNKLGLAVGLDGLTTLKKLNLQHNCLTTLSGLSKLPNLIELKFGWNYIRFLHSNASTLAWAAPRLMTVEVLPNPFQDIRDYAHIPVLLKKFLPVLHRVDIWTAPFNTQSPLNKFAPPVVADSGFAHVAMAKTWVGTAHSYNDLSNRCLTDLDLMPNSPPFPEGFGSNGMDLNISDNYLNSHALAYSHFVQSVEWRTCLVKLQLQENMISSLEWAKEKSFPNVQIVNLSNNSLTNVDSVSESFPSLRYLQLSGNPLSCDIAVLSPIRLLDKLCTLDCFGSPLASHPDYSGYVIKFLPSVQILDGIPLTNWELNDSVDRYGGNLTNDWLEDKIGHRNFNTLTRLSFTNSNLQKISLPSQSLTKLMSLDLHDNSLSALTNLHALPSLRVLSLSHNSITTLGSQPCPTCFTHTVESMAINAQRLIKSPTKGEFQQEMRKTLASEFGISGKERGIKNHTNAKGIAKYAPPVGGTQQSRIKSKSIFPKLEVLILSHNGISALNDLHFHAMPTLQTVILNCNNLTSLQGLNDLPTVKAIVLDRNRIKDIPRNSLIGCNSLRYLHLEHNRISALPRLPHLTNLTSLYLSFNKIQSLTDLSFLAGSGVTEMTMMGNPATLRSDYRLNLKARIPQLSSLDGQDLSWEQNVLDNLTGKWFSGTLNTISEYAAIDPVFRVESNGPVERSGVYQEGSEFGLKVRSLSPQLATSAQRSLQYSGFKPAKRQDY